MPKTLPSTALTTTAITKNQIADGRRTRCRTQTIVRITTSTINMLTAPKNKEFSPVPAGNHVARLSQIIHTGTITDSYMGEQKQVDKIRPTFELCNERKAFK